MIIVKSREEVSVLYLFSKEEYKGLNRQQKFDKAIADGWTYILSGKFRKEIEY